MKNADEVESICNELDQNCIKRISSNEHELCLCKLPDGDCYWCIENPDNHYSHSYVFNNDLYLNGYHDWKLISYELYEMMIKELCFND